MGILEDKYYEIRYLFHVHDEPQANAAGTVRLWLSEIPGWLAGHPGAMITAIRGA